MRNIETLNQLLTEFYDKMAAWEQAVVKDSTYSLAQVHTVEVLGIHGAMRMKELAQKLGITTGTLTVQIDKLVSEKLIERCDHPNDRRAIVVKLTKKGQKIHQHHNQLHLDLVTDLTRNIDPEHEQALINSLQHINSEF